MATYRYFFINAAGEAKAAQTYEFKDDLDAFEKAKQLANGFEVEVWHGPIRIAHVKAGDAPHTEHDRIPG